MKKTFVWMVITWSILIAPEGKAAQDARLSAMLNKPGAWGLILNSEGEMDMAPLLSTNVQLKVTGPLVRAVVRQEFNNPWNRWAEGVYVFPLPAGAAVDGMRLRIGDRVIEGMIQEKKEAKKTYDAAKAQGKRAGLVDQNRPNIF
ncbi:MAG: VIT domain-containing protein, partial [Nitrospinota bacterium]|nr:VIT domain-containing protein [Nitrospinota bacterium]